MKVHGGDPHRPGRKGLVHGDREEPRLRVCMPRVQTTLVGESGTPVFIEFYRDRQCDVF